MALDSGAAGYSAVDVAAFAGANSRAYLSAVFAAYRQGRVVVSLPRQAPPAIPGLRIVERHRFEPDPGWFAESVEPICSDAPAQISFSSGTTGAPKAILLSHRALSDVVGRINAAMQVDGSIREYVGVPVTFSFGFGRVRAVAAAGGAAYLPAHGFDPAEIARMLEAGEINAVSAVPTLWRVVLAHPEAIGRAGERVRWIEIGSQYMSGDEKTAMKRLFPNARIVQHYGLTEASRTTLLDVGATEGPALDSVGCATGAVEIGVTPDGAIRIRGPHLAEGLVTEEGVAPVTDADGWLVTADRGRIEDGRLFYEGRIDELINVGGVKIDPTRFEQRLSARLGRPGAAAVGRLPDPLRGERVLVALRRDARLGRNDVARAARAVADEHGLVGGGAIVVRTVQEIPVTPTGKIRRNDLPALPDLGETEPAEAAGDAEASADARAAKLQAIWASALGVVGVPLDESFYDLGGDSLSALTVTLGMEAEGIDAETARGVFDGRTIAELAGLPAAAARPEIPPAEPALTLPEAMSAVHSARGVLALWVVFVHWSPGVLERLPGAPIWLYHSIEPLLRFGTPGFALVFGVGIGALAIPQYQRNPRQFRSANWLKFWLVAAGVLLLALFSAGAGLAGGDLGPNWPSRLFYSAISFYALALLTLPWLLRLLTAWPHVLVTIFAAMAASMALHEILSSAMAWRQPGGFLELAKILLTAKYGFFRMMGYVLIGAGIGYLFRQHYRRPEIPRLLALWGLVLLATGALVAQKARPGSIFQDVDHVLPWHVAIYAGAVLLLMSLFCRLNRAGAGRSLGWVGAVLTVTGILALPIFVGHELVGPTKKLLVHLGVAQPIALGATLGVFFAGSAWCYSRLLRLLPPPGAGSDSIGPDPRPSPGFQSAASMAPREVSAPRIRPKKSSTAMCSPFAAAKAGEAGSGR